MGLRVKVPVTVTVTAGTLADDLLPVYSAEYRPQQVRTVAAVATDSLLCSYATQALNKKRCPELGLSTVPSKSAKGKAVPTLNVSTAI